MTNGRALILLVFIYSTYLSSCQNGKNEYISQLREVDSILVSLPDDALSRLEGVDIDNLTHHDRVYYNLLYTIAADKTYYNFESDSLIYTTTSGSTFRNDHYNRFRANLYHGIVKFRIDEYDSTGYYLLLKANEICESYRIPNDSYKRLLYWYMADYNKMYSNFILAEEYFQKERVVIKMLEDNHSMHKNNIALYWVYRAQQKSDDMRRIVDLYENDDSIPQAYMIDVYNMRTSYYYYIDDYEKTIEYGKREAKLRSDNNLRVKIYYNIADSYYELNQIDSAIKYMRLSLDNNLTGSSQENLQLAFHYNKMLSRLYADKGDYKSSYIYSEEALKYHDEVVKFHSNNSAQNMERLLEIEKRDREIERMWASRKFMGAIIIAVILISLLLFSLLRIRTAAHKREAEYNAQRRFKADIIRSIIDVTVGQFDQLSDYMYGKIHERRDEVLSDLLEERVKFIKKQNREIFSQILKREALISYFPLLPKLTEFSVYETMVFLLIRLELSPEYIARIYYTTSNSVRGVKSRIREKIKKSIILTAEEKEELLSLTDY